MLLKTVLLYNFFYIGVGVILCFLIKMIPSLCFYSCKCNTRVFQK